MLNESSDHIIGNSRAVSTEKCSVELFRSICCVTKSNLKSDSNYLGKLAFFVTNNAHTRFSERVEKKTSRFLSAFSSPTFAIRLGLKKSRENWNVPLLVQIELAQSQPLDHSAQKLSFKFIPVEFQPLWLTHARGGAFKMFSTVVTQHKLQSLVTTNLSKLCLPNPTRQTLPRTI